MKSSKVLALAVAAGLAGCGTLNYITKTYSDIRVIDFAGVDDTYRIFDRPDIGRLMITPSFGAAMGTR